MLQQKLDRGDVYPVIIKLVFHAIVTPYEDKLF